MKIRQSTALVSLVLKKEKRMLTFKTLWDNKNAGEEPILKRIILKHLLHLNAEIDAAFCVF